MPVRKIPKNYLGVTGGFASRKNNRLMGFESLLEKDYMLLLEYDEDVQGFEEQPVTIPVIAPKQRKTKYVPDVLVHYYPNSMGEMRKSVLVEVKRSQDMKKYKAKFAAKFAAAALFADERGWEFKILTEKDIRLPRLPFLKFLREYYCIAPSSKDMAKVTDILNLIKGRSTRYCDLIDQLCKSDDEKLAMIPVVWHMVATKRIHADLNKPVTDTVRLVLPKEGTKA